MTACVSCTRVYRDPPDADGLCNLCAQRKKAAAGIKAREDRFVKETLARWKPRDEAMND